MDDGAPDMDTALAMARMAVADGIMVMACTPAILPHVHNNSPAFIQNRLMHFQERLAQAAIPLDVVAGSVAHARADFLQALSLRQFLTINKSRYLLCNLPEMVPPPRLEELMARILEEGFVPVIARPERLKWIAAHLNILENLVEGGVWLQLTAGSLTGHYGHQALYWAEALLDAGMVHILASDAHNLGSRPPLLSEAYEFARAAVGADEALNLISTRPVNILDDLPADQSPAIGFARPRNEEPKWLWPRLARVS